MVYRLIYAALAILALAGVAVAQWPSDLPQPKGGMKAYEATRLTQRLVILHDRPSHRWYDVNQDDVFANAPTMFNPNRQSPWRVSGGMEGLKGWKSIKFANVKPSDVPVRTVGISITGTSTLLPGFRWSYPDGTVFADLLTNDRGEMFELRVRSKESGKWTSVVAFEDASKAPTGYKGAGKCASCHDHAGSSKQYGIMVRGGDTVFSFLPTTK